MVGKKLLLVMVWVTATSFALPEKFTGEQSAKHENKHDCFKGLRKNDPNTLYQYVQSPDGTWSWRIVDNSRSEQINSGIRACAVSTLIGFVAQGYANKNQSDVVTHLLGLITVVAANLFIGGIACKDRNIMTQVGGGLTGYIVGSVGRASIK